MAYKKLSPKQRELKKSNRLYPFSESTPFWNLLKRRKKCYDAYRDWLEQMKDAGFLELPDDYDPRHLTKFHFNFVSHARHRRGVITKSLIYEQLSILLSMLDGCEGFCRPVEVFYRYISDPSHSNLDVKPSALKRQVLWIF